MAKKLKETDIRTHGRTDGLPLVLIVQPISMNTHEDARDCPIKCHLKFQLLGDPEVTANLHCNFPYPYWEGCVIYSIYLR